MISFKFFLGNDEYKVKYKNIFQHKLKGIDKQSIKDRKYNIKTNIKKENFEIFIDFLQNCSLPCINVDNLRELKNLNEELQAKGFKSYISSFEEKIFKDKQIVDAVKDSTKSNVDASQQDVSKYIAFIAKNLDYFLSEYSELIKEFEFQKIYEIFNHPSRKLVNENSGFNFIKEMYQKTNQKEYLLIFQSFHIEKLSEEIIQEIYSSLEEPEIELVPQFHKTFFQEEMKKMELEFEKERDKLNREIENFIQFRDNTKKEINEMKEKLADEIKNIQEMKAELKAELKVEINQKANKVQFEDIPKNKKSKFLIEGLFKLLYEMNSNEFIKAEKSQKGKGLLACLKEKEEPFKPLFVSSISSRDPYDLMRSNWQGFYITSNHSDFIEFEIENKENISGILIKSADINFMKKYQILVDDRIVCEMDETKPESLLLNSKNKEIELFFEQPVLGNRIKISPQGLNWDRNSLCIELRKVEIFSQEHVRGIFRSMNNGNNDTHHLPVIVHTGLFSTESFYNFGSKKIVNTINGGNEKFKISFIKGFVWLDSYRFAGSIMKGWRIEGQSIVEKSWEEITSYPRERVSNTQDQTGLFDIKPRSHQMYKKIRLIRTEPNSDSSLSIYFTHFEIFGKYFG